MYEWSLPMLRNVTTSWSLVVGWRVSKFSLVRAAFASCSLLSPTHRHGQTLPLSPATGWSEERMT